MKKVRVHILDPTGGVPLSGIDDPDELFQMIELGAKTPYRTIQWVVGKDLTAEQAEKWKDPETGDIYIVTTYRDGKPLSHACDKATWEEIKEKFNNI